MGAVPSEYCHDELSLVVVVFFIVPQCWQTPPYDRRNAWSFAPVASLPWKILVVRLAVDIGLFQ
jgi:hypothetical protein